MDKQAGKKKTVKQGIDKKKLRPNYTSAFREKLVRMHVDDKIPLDLLAKESKVSKSSITIWVKRYHTDGVAGLVAKVHPGRAPTLPTAVSDKIVEIKKENPSFGVRRIGDILSRWFGLPGSRETVRRVLNNEELIEPPKKIRAKNMVKPRFFERSTPNQMWQTDIMCFRLGGRQVYLIGFVDDYSRYMVGLGLFSSQTAENVLEVYRKATTEYGVPKEMLTDNGRQYTSWRGTTRFEGELAKDKVKHIKSQPHHPQTLGKIERFWKTILDEYLSRAQFDSFENARERIAMWVKHYNHRRPHQGIEGVCPADRFFEVATEVRKVIERQIQENILEMALRGKPREPFYLVGRMDGQSVVLQAEKGKLKLSVGGDGTSEMTQKEFEVGSTNGAAEQAVQFITEGSSGTSSVDGTPQATGNLSRTGDQLDYIKPVAEASDGRSASGARTPCEFGAGSGPESTPPSSFGATSNCGCGKEIIPPPCPQSGTETGTLGEPRIEEHAHVRRAIGEGPQTNVRDTTSGGRADDCDSRRSGAGDLTAGVLRMVESSHGCDDRIVSGPSSRETIECTGSSGGTIGARVDGDQGRPESSHPSSGYQENAGVATQRSGDIFPIWVGR